MAPLATEVAVFLVGAASGLFAGRLRRARVPDAQPAAVAPETEPPRDDRFERLVAALPLATVIVDRDGRITALNPAAARDFGADARRMLGRALIEMIPSIELERQVESALRGESTTRSIALTAAQGERTFTFTVYPLSQADGVAVIADEVTQRIELERVRRDFISNVSHELRTPLSAIKLMVETVLLSEGDPEAINLFLPKVQHEVDRMVQLIEDLLALARSESGRLPLRREQFDVAELAGSVLHTFEQRAATLEVHLELRVRAHVTIDADRNRLTQVLVNLVDNALRHTPAGGRITLIVERDGGDAVFSVADTGVGIPYSDLPHIFERFYVVERSRARERSGTGLGLSIAKQLMEAHGGSISAESDLGRGATFRCRLPAQAERSLTVR